MVDILATFVALLCLWGILEKAIPTGLVGSFGLVLIGGAALVATDDSAFADIQRLDLVVVALLCGFLLVVGQVALLVWKANTGRATPKRRVTDLGELDESQHPHVVGGVRE